MRWIPNAITLLRLLFLVPIVTSLLEHAYWSAFFWYLAAVLLDGVDGYAARKLDARTRSGKHLDLLADGALGWTVLVVLFFQGQIPYWFAALLLVLVSLELYSLYLSTREHGEWQHSPYKNLVGGSYFAFTLALIAPWSYSLHLATALAALHLGLQINAVRHNSAAAQH